MLEFHPLQLEDLPKLRDFFAYSGSRICDTTPGTVFMWRDMYHTEWAVHDGSLYFKVDYPGLGPTFTLPWEAAGRSTTARSPATAAGGACPSPSTPSPRTSWTVCKPHFPTRQPSPPGTLMTTCIGRGSPVLPWQKAQRSAQPRQQIFENPMATGPSGSLPRRICPQWEPSWTAMPPE